MWRHARICLDADEAGGSAALGISIVERCCLPPISDALGGQTPEDLVDTMW